MKGSNCLSWEGRRDLVAISASEAFKGISTPISLSNNPTSFIIY